LSAAVYFARESLLGTPLIKELRPEYPPRLLCRVLEVSQSGYHAWLRRVPSERARSRERLKLAALAAHTRTRQTYGARRLQRELAANGFAASLGTVKRVRRELGLCCIQHKRRLRVATTDSRHSHDLGEELQVSQRAFLRVSQVGVSTFLAHHFNHSLTQPRTPGSPDGPKMESRRGYHVCSVSHSQKKC
jgi:hypothetical protein